MSYLFAKNVMTQSMKLELTNAWNESHSELMKTLTLINNKCFTLIQNFLFFHERIQKNDDEIQMHHIHENDKHHFVQLSLKDFFENNLKMKSIFKLMKFSSQHSFLQQLILTYQREYKMSMMIFEFKSIKWYRKLNYIDS